MSRKYKITNLEGVYFLTLVTVNWNSVFIRKEYNEMIVDSLRFCQRKKGLKIHAWCLMTSHLHMVVSADHCNLADIIRDFKKFTSKSMIRLIKEHPHESRRKLLLKEFEEAGIKNSNNQYYQFWQQHNMPKELTTNAMIDQKIEYIHKNPVKASVCVNPEDYIYSSANAERQLISIEEI